METHVNAAPMNQWAFAMSCGVELSNLKYQ